MSEEKISQIFS